MRRITVTVGEIAQRIKEPGEELSAIVDRLRSWTKEGLLKPLGKRKPGTGVKRVYAERAIIDAAILSLLSRHYGAASPKMLSLFAGALAGLDAALDKAVSQLSKVKPAEEELEQDVYLIVGMLQGQQGVPSAPWQIISDIQYVDFDRLSRSIKHGPPKRLLKIPALMGDGLFINLTLLFKRLGVPLAETEARAKVLKELAEMFPGIEGIERG
jgi:hypothetical protein